MDLDTAIDIVRDLGSAWKSTGAPHQQQLGEAMLVLVLYATGNIEPIARAVTDPFMEAAERARLHAAQGKPASRGHLEEERTHVMPIETIVSEGMPKDAAMFLPSRLHTQDDMVKAIVLTGLGTAGMLPPIEATTRSVVQAQVETGNRKIRRLAKRS